MCACIEVLQNKNFLLETEKRNIKMTTMRSAVITIRLMTECMRDTKTIPQKYKAQHGAL